MSRKLRIGIVSLQGCLALALACAGSGEGLDEFGNPLGAGGVGILEPTLTSIQARVFTPICTRCHAGPSAPLGFSLEASVSYEQTVNVPSVEAPQLLRIKPGAPDESYLVLKAEGAPGITGGRMPLGLPALSAEQLDAVRIWIENGAPQN